LFQFESYISKYLIIFNLTNHTIFMKHKLFLSLFLLLSAQIVFSQAWTTSFNTAGTTTQYNFGTTNANMAVSLGNTLNNTKLALFDGNTGASNYGFGIQANQMRFHVGWTGAKFSFLSSAAATTELMTILGTGDVEE